MMLESVSERLCGPGGPHELAPDKRVLGRLSGACSWGPPGPHSRSETDSSIIPWLAETSRSSASSRRPRMPALGWGRSPVRSSTRRHIAAR